MKKVILILAATCTALFQLFAVESAKNDTTIRFNKKTIHFEDSVGQLKVSVFDNDLTPYNKVYEGIFSEDKSYEKWTVAEELGIQIPFLNKINAIKKKSYKMEAHWAGIGWGFANITDFNSSNYNGELSLKAESSNEFFFSVIEKILPIYRNNIGITSGLGFNWKNYFLDNNQHLLEVDNVTAVYDAPAGINYDKSRLRTFQITVPLLLEFQPTFAKNHKFFVSAGAIAGVNTFTSYKVKYQDASGHTVKFVESKALNVAPITLDFMAQVGYDDWSLYAKYSPFSIFQSGKGPDVQSVSLGAMLHF